MHKRLLLLAVLLAAPTWASAERPAKYFGLTVGEHELTDESNNTTETTNFGLRGGYQLSKFIGLEVRGGWESGSTSGALDSPDLFYAGAFGRFDLPYEGLNVFFLLGAAGVEYDVGNDTESESDAAGGIGIELYGSERTAVTLDYMNYANGAYEGVSIGFVHHFNWPSFRR